jgi:4-amino-4-deoxy-L-arabinose transferase-like glycosyltransferase
MLLSGARIIQSGSQIKWLKKVLDRLGEWLDIHQGQVLYLGLGIAFAISATLAAGFELFMHNSWIAVISWFLGIILILLGSWKRSENFFSLSKQTLIWVGFFFVLGFAIRGFDTTNIPRILTGDESSSGLSAVGFLEGSFNNLFTVGWYSFPSFYYYIQSISISLLGQTAAALRIPSAIVGGLTTASIYLLGRYLYDHRKGLLAALFLSGFHLHVHFSRIGLNNIWDGLWFVLTLGALWLGWHRNRRGFFLLAGLCLGFSQYFYTGARMLLGVIPLWLIVVTLFNWKKLKDNYINLILMVLITLIVILPLAWYFINHPNQFLAPFARVKTFGVWMENEITLQNKKPWQIMINQMSLSLQSFISIPIMFWYPAGVPLIRSTSSGVFFIGLGLLLLRIKDSRTWLLFFWMAAFVLAGGLSVPVPAAQRLVGVTPVCALIIGFAVGEIADLLTKLWEKRAAVFNIAAIIVILILVISDINFYFLEFTPLASLGAGNGQVAQTLAYYLQEKSEDWQVAFFGVPRMGYHSISSLSYLAPHIEGVNMDHPWGSDQNPELTSDHVIFVFLPNHEDNLRAIQEAYPTGELAEEYESDGDLLYWYYEVSPLE